MAKISSYGTKIPPSLTDMMIGTDTTSTPINLTKNFTIEELQSLITDGTLYYRKKLVPAVVQTLFSSPNTLIPAPGAGKAIWFQRAVWSVNPAGPWAFPAPTRLTLRYTGSPNDLTVSLSETELNSATTRVYNLIQTIASMADNLLLENTAVEVATTNDAPLLAGEMYMGVVYKIINTPTLIVDDT